MNFTLDCQAPSMTTSTRHCIAYLLPGQLHWATMPVAVQPAVALTIEGIKAQRQRLGAGKPQATILSGFNPYPSIQSGRCRQRLALA